MKLKTKFWLAGAAVSTAAALFWAFMPSPVAVETAPVSKGRFELAVEEDGKTRLRDRYVVSAPIAGTLSRIVLRQGDIVEKGALLGLLEPNPPALLDARARQAQQARVGETSALLRQADAELQRAGAAYDQALSDWMRIERLAEHGYVSLARAESDRAAYRIAETAMRSARQRRIAALYADEQARAGLRQFQPDRARGDPERIEIRAPVGGRILRVAQQSEASVQTGAVLVEVGDPAQTEVVAAVLTTDAASLQPGASVSLTGWGGAEALAGRLRLIEPAAFTKVSALGVEEQRVHAVIDILTPAQKWLGLGDGFHLDVRILRQAVDNVIKVPSSAVFNRGGRTEVFVAENGRARRKAIELAARNGDEAWVKAGLSPGDQVIVYPSDAVADGKRIRVRKP